MIEILKPTIECAELSEDGSYGRYVIAPLERGYGTTLGNSLRRVLLSSLTGAAVTAIKIDNIYHEFSAVQGIVEDMTEIILNIKGIRHNGYPYYEFISMLIMLNILIRIDTGFD